jgi:hypothetical protein
MVALPSYTLPVVLLTDIVVASLVVAGTDRAARRADLSNARRRRLTAVVAGVLAVWAATAGLVAWAGLGVRHPLVLGVIGGPVVLGVAALRVSATWRTVVGAVPQVWFVGGQAYRVVGALFLALWIEGHLPAYFAVPAGVGDVVTGVGAVLVAGLLVRARPGRRTATALWNVVGLADLVVAVGAGSTLLAGALTTVFAAETTTAVVVGFPLGLIPLFLVPISATLHLYSLRALRVGTSVSTTVGTEAGETR